MISHVASTAEQGHGVRTQWPGSPWKQGLTDVSGARGVAAPVSRTGQCRHEWTQKLTAMDGTPEPKNEKKGPTAGRRVQPLRERADLQLVIRVWPTAGRQGQSAFSQRDKKQPSVVSRSPRHSALNKIVETPGVTERAHRPRQSRQRSKIGSSPVAVHRRGHRDPCLDAEAAWIQKIVEIPQLQFMDEKVDTVIMQKSSSSPSSTVNSEDASDSGSGNATEW